MESKTILGCSSGSAHCHGQYPSGSAHHANRAALDVSNSDCHFLQSGARVGLDRHHGLRHTPLLRLTTLAFNQVPRELIELGQAIGASKTSILLKIEMPAARSTILLGLN